MDNSGIRKAPKHFGFIKLQLVKISELDHSTRLPTRWAQSALDMTIKFCEEILGNQSNLDLVTLTKSIEGVLSSYIRTRTEDKELARKKSRKLDQLKFVKLTPRQKEVENYTRKLKSTRGIDPQLDSICALLDLYRSGRERITLGGVPKPSELKVKKIVALKQVADFIEMLGIYPKKPNSRLVYSISTAYAEWNCHSIGGLRKTTNALFSSKPGWIPNS